MSAFLAALASSAVADTISKLAIGFLQVYLDRKDLTEKVRLEIANAMLELSVRANAWKAEATTRPDGGGDLRVQSGAGTVHLPGDHPDSPGGSGGV